MRFLLCTLALFSVAVLVELPRCLGPWTSRIWSQQVPASSYGNAAVLDRARNRWLFFNPSGESPSRPSSGRST